MRGLYARAWYYYAARGRPSPECGTTTDTANDPFATAPRRLSWPFGLQNSGCDRYRQQVRFPGLFRHLLTIGLQARDVSLDGLDRALPALLDSPAARETAGKRAFRRRVTAAPGWGTEGRKHWQGARRRSAARSQASQQAPRTRSRAP